MTHVDKEFDVLGHGVKNYESTLLIKQSKQANILQFSSGGNEVIYRKYPSKLRAPEEESDARQG